ncbi:MAG: hypothetical protein A2589_03495 [Candidatus Vogelbacteria bacterium RIFOXYD1_FULL_46_19]|uniref:Glycine-rich domain-containing protein-like n=1 Tax=Candidatus Vogelbacteria bacterium RIFOXYD1_FULL_46_19 TaxID=1802439 RepID=A0A1G2QFT2_9BACT|nr:MAG: hypothetical protein A2589_03495 [Candidatus Vogelbacteria bacterium RIFOXYD1_FULL_46_19]
MAVLSLAPYPDISLARVIPQVVKKNSDWSDEYLERVQEEYRRFLQLCKTYPEHKISAPPAIDELWHAHMLDSVHYMSDCDLYFGYYLHHDPCVSDEVDLEGGNNTLKIYTETYGVEPPDIWVGLMTCANPGQGCGSVPIR